MSVFPSIVHVTMIPAASCRVTLLALCTLLLGGLLLPAPTDLRLVTLGTLCLFLFYL